jgi:hypothetical protein
MNRISEQKAVDEKKVLYMDYICIFILLIYNKRR